jgi:pimeloyl-ACP methyl ester carboxylesterase
MLNSLYQVLLEITLIVLYPLFSIFAHFIPKSMFNGNGKGQTIVIVERWLTINIRHVYWKFYLERRGFNVYLANFSLWHGDFEASAKDLKKYIERKNLKDIILVGESSGAITSLLYLQELEGWEKVRKFIAIGAPFKGTWIAILLSFVPSGRQLWPVSGLMSKMSQFEIKNPEKITCIRAKFDEMVPTGSVLKGAREVRIGTIGHNNLHLGMGRTYAKIIEIANSS